MSPGRAECYLSHGGMLPPPLLFARLAPRDGRLFGRAVIHGMEEARDQVEPLRVVLLKGLDHFPQMLLVLRDPVQSGVTSHGDLVVRDAVGQGANGSRGVE